MSDGYPKPLWWTNQHGFGMTGIPELIAKEEARAQAIAADEDARRAWIRQATARERALKRALAR